MIEIYINIEVQVSFTTFQKTLIKNKINLVTFPSITYIYSYKYFECLDRKYNIPIL